ncbi:MAG: hypothetical protein K2N03_06010 [Muribaculaceae bacterium]|nr:hypothetical protein [Muribaculaceae bacterium]
MKKLTLFLGAGLMLMAVACKSEKAPEETVNVISIEEATGDSPVEADTADVAENTQEAPQEAPRAATSDTL